MRLILLRQRCGRNACCPSRAIKDVKRTVHCTMLRQMTFVAVLSLCLWPSACRQPQEPQAQTLQEPQAQMLQEPQAQTPLGQLAASMAPHTWAPLTTTNIQPTLTNTIGGASGNIIEYSDELVWNAVAKKVFFLGGDHKVNPADTRDHPRFVSYTDSTNTWQREADPPWMLNSMNFHAYDHHAIDPATGNMYYRIGNQDTGAGNIYKYTLATHTWSAIPKPVDGFPTYGV